MKQFEALPPDDLLCKIFIEKRLKEEQTDRYASMIYSIFSIEKQWPFVLLTNRRCTFVTIPFIENLSHEELEKYSKDVEASVLSFEDMDAFPLVKL